MIKQGGGDGVVELVGVQGGAERGEDVGRGGRWTYRFHATYAVDRCRTLSEGGRARRVEVEAPSC